MKAGKQFFGLALCLGAATFLASCGKAKQAQATKDPLRSVPVRTFERLTSERKLKLSNATVFLWREDLTSEQVRTVALLPGKMAKIRKGVAGMQQQLERLEKTPGMTEEQKQEMSRETLKLEKKIKLGNKKIASASAELTESKARKEELEKQKQEMAQNGAKAEDLAEMDLAIAEAQKKIEEQSASLAKTEEETAQLQQQLGQMSSQTAARESDMERLQVQKGSLKLDIQAHQESFMQLLDQFNSTVFWFDTFSGVELGAKEDGALIVNIDQWDMKDGRGAQKYTTEDGSIRNVSYVEEGGVYSFDVLVFTDAARNVVQETYTFKLTRSKYKDSDEGDWIYFGGELTKTTSDHRVRKGSISLSNQPG
jgi:hypothetical protein